MSRTMLPGFFIVVGPAEKLVILADTLGIPGALRFRTRAHADQWLEKHEADAVAGNVARRFGGEAA